MKASDFSQLVAKVIDNLNADKCEPIKTPEGFPWQDFTPLSREEAKELKACEVVGTVSDGGSVTIRLTVCLSDFDRDKNKEAYKHLKSKNLCILAAEAMQDSIRKENEANKLIAAAADAMGIPVADVEKIVATETEG